MPGWRPFTGSSPAVLLHDSICHGDGEQQNDSGYLILLHGFLFCIGSMSSSLPGSDFYRSIVKPEAYGYFRLVLVFDGDSVLVHKIRQFDGFIANLAAAVRQF